MLKYVQDNEEGSYLIFFFFIFQTTPKDVF
jgi:hypothetical protein